MLTQAVERAFSRLGMGYVSGDARELYEGFCHLTDAGDLLVGMIVRVFVAGTAGMLMDMFARGFLCLAPCKDLAPYLAYISKWMALPAGAQRHGGFTHIFLQSGLSGGGTALPFSSIVTG